METTVAMPMDWWILYKAHGCGILESFLNAEIQHKS